MNVGSTAFRALLCVGWIILFVLSYQAVVQMGIGVAGPVFFADFAHPWRAQFNADFAIHLLAASTWMIYRSPSWWIGVLCAVLEINFGALFLLTYLLAASVAAKGDYRRVLLGSRS